MVDAEDGEDPDRTPCHCAGTDNQSGALAAVGHRNDGARAGGFFTTDDVPGRTDNADNVATGGYSARDRSDDVATADDGGNCTGTDCFAADNDAAIDRNAVTVASGQLANPGTANGGRAGGGPVDSDTAIESGKLAGP